MDRKRSVLRWGGVLLAATLVAAACGDDSDGAGGGTGGASSGGNELTIALGPGMPSMDPQFTNDMWVKIVHYDNLAETLTTLDGDGELVPLLATTFALVDDSTWRFELQEGVTFHNGEPFDAEAAKFSLDRITSEGVATHVGYFSSYESSTVVDEYTLDVTTVNPDPDFPRKLTFAPMVPPEHAQSAEGALDAEPIGTGPYVFERRLSDGIVLAKNPDYWNGEVEGPDRVTVIQRPEASARVAALRAGEVDIIRPIPPELMGDAPSTVNFPGPSKIIIPLNAANGITADPRVREAIVLAVDNEGIREALLPGLSRPGECQFPIEGITGYNPELENQSYDPDRARQLLEEAGVVGETIAFYVPIGDYVQGEQAGELVAQQIEAVGLEVDLQIVEKNVWLDTVFQPKDSRVESFMVGATFDSGTVTQPFDAYVTLDQTLEAFAYDEYPEFGDQLVAARSTIDEDERAEALATVTQTICDSNTFLFLYSPDLVYGVADDVELPDRRDERLPFQDIRING